MTHVQAALIAAALLASAAFAGAEEAVVPAGTVSLNLTSALGKQIAMHVAAANPTALSLAMPEICVEGRAEEGVTAFRRCFPPDVDKLEPEQARDAEFLVLDPAGAVREIELRKAAPPR